MKGLKEILDYLENLIDLEHCRQTEKLHAEAMDFKNVDTLPLSVSYPANSGFFTADYSYAKAFEDVDAMLCRELTAIGDNIINSVNISDDYPLQIRANYGIGIIASLFGAEILVIDDNMPWVRHLDDKAFRAAITHGLPPLKGGIAAKVEDAYCRFADALKDYPKCHEAVKITQPDMQGPFDNLHLIRGSDVLYDIYDDPDMLHEALGLITETMIAYKRSTMPLLNDAAGDGKIYIHGAIYGGQVLIKEDTAFATISESSYEEFCAPYNKRIYEAFGGMGSLHFCGPSKAWHPGQVKLQNICCLNFGDPQMQDLFSVWEMLKEKRISVASFGEGQSYSFIQNCLERGLRTGATLKCTAENENEAKRILNNHYEWCEKYLSSRNAFSQKISDF